MSNGIYIAGTGLLNCTGSINVAANNITNSETAGFKKDSLVAKSFGEYMLYKNNGEGSAQIGGSNYGVSGDQVYTQFAQGSLQHTGRTMDLAIEGEGFFTLQTPTGERLLTRNGQFFLNADGMLTDSTGNLVLGEAGPLKVDSTDFTVSDAGEIMVNGTACGTLLITTPADTASLSKKEGVSFSNPNTAQETNLFSGSIKQGFLEGSNVDLIEEMTNMMAFTRSYQSCSQMIKMMDQVMEKTVNEIARL